MTPAPPAELLPALETSAAARADDATPPPAPASPSSSSSASSPSSPATAAAPPSAVAAATDAADAGKRSYKVMTPCERDLALRLVAGGTSKTDAARALGVARSTLSTNLKRLRAQAEASDAPPPAPRSRGRPPVLHEAALARIHAWADEHRRAPSAAAAGAKNPRQLTAAVRSEFGIAVSEATVRRVLLEYADATAENFDGVLTFRDGGASTAKLVRLLDSAKRAVYIYMLTFTCRAFLEVVVALKKRGVEVLVITDFVTCPVWLFTALKAANIPVRFTSQPQAQTLPHANFAIVDGRTAALGLFDWTPESYPDNDGLVDITSTVAKVAAVESLFSRRWDEFEYVQAQVAAAMDDESKEPDAKRRLAESS